MGDIKDEVVEIARKLLEIFTVQYTKEYALGLVAIAKEEANAPPKPDWHLSKRPGWTEDYKSGFLTKEGGSTKSWKKRWFVVKPNYNVEYYENEAAVAKGPKAAKGIINLTGYWVKVDPNESVLGRLRELAKKMGVEFDSLPKQKEYPPLTFELYHSRRRCYFITASSKDEFDDWVAQFRTCCWYARGYSLEDEAHLRAFPVAVRKTRWEMGRWGWYNNYGSEEQVLAEMIADELDYEVMGKAYSKLQGPYFVRNMLRNKISKLLDQTVLGMVKPSWAGMAKTVETLRPKIEPKIKSSVDPIFKAENDIIEKMKEKVMSIISPLQEEHVNKHLEKIVENVRKPMEDAFEEAIKIYEEKIDKFEPKSGQPLDKSFSELDWFPRSYWEMRPATVKTEDMIEGLKELQPIFKDLWPWGVCYNAQSTLREITDNAVYTWEHALLKHCEDGASTPDKEIIDKLKKQTLEKFRHDAEIATFEFCAKSMRDILVPPFEAVVKPASRSTVEPMAETIPETLAEFIDINKDFEDLYMGMINDSISNALKN